MGALARVGSHSSNAVKVRGPGPAPGLCLSWVSGPYLSLPDWAGSGGRGLQLGSRHLEQVRWVAVWLRLQVGWHLGPPPHALAWASAQGWLDSSALSFSRDPASPPRQGQAGP